MIVDNKKFYGGLGLLISFAIVFVLIFMPLLNGQNGLEYLDDLYNSISKGSAYYIPKLKEEASVHNGKAVTLKIQLNDPDQVKQTAMLFSKSGASVKVSDLGLEISGDLGKILDNCLKDIDLMYLNKGETVTEKYGYNERLALYNWWVASNLMDKNLKKQSLFKEAKVVSTVQKKGIETAYNYYGIEPQKISDKWGVVIFSLIFYVVYTLWYGFGIMYLFEGWGMQLEH